MHEKTRKTIKWTLAFTLILMPIISLLSMFISLSAVSSQEQAGEIAKISHGLITVVIICLGVTEFSVYKAIKAKLHYLPFYIAGSIIASATLFIEIFFYGISYGLCIGCSYQTAPKDILWFMAIPFIYTIIVILYRKFIKKRI